MNETMSDCSPKLLQSISANIQRIPLDPTIKGIVRLHFHAIHDSQRNYAGRKQIFLSEVFPFQVKACKFDMTTF